MPSSFWGHSPIYKAGTQFFLGTEDRILLLWPSLHETWELPESGDDKEAAGTQGRELGRNLTPERANSGHSTYHKWVLEAGAKLPPWTPAPNKQAFSPGFPAAVFPKVWDLLCQGQKRWQQGCGRKALSALESLLFPFQLFANLSP